MFVLSLGDHFKIFPATTLLNLVSYVDFLLAGDEQPRPELKPIEQHKLIGV
jgi:hypothetical protein